jgi:hypothetical protein
MSSTGVSNTALDGPGLLRGKGVGLSSGEFPSKEYTAVCSWTPYDSPVQVTTTTRTTVQQSISARIRTLNKEPSDTVDLITTRIYAAVDTIHTVHGDVDAADPSSADLLHVIVDDMERAEWMLKSENRKI